MICLVYQACLFLLYLLYIYTHLGLLCFCGKLTSIRMKYFSLSMFIILLPKSIFFYVNEVKRSESCSVMSNSLWSHGLYKFMEFSRPECWSGQPFPSLGDLPNPGIEPRSPTLQADSSPAEPEGKPKNTRVGSLSLLQGIFRTQEWNPGSPARQADSLPTEL